jgi:hypothetical protein
MDRMKRMFRILFFLFPDGEKTVNVGARGIFEDVRS